MTLQPFEPSSDLVAAPAPAARAMSLAEWANEATAANQLARALCKTAFAGPWQNDADGATAAILRGAEVGLTPVTSLSAFDKIQGTPAPKALTLRALVQSKGHEVILTESTERKAVVKARRAGSSDWQAVTWTIERASKLGLTKREQWTKQPGAMLVARATSEACRLVAADVILGIGYTVEEMVDETTAAPAAQVMRRSTPQGSPAAISAPELTVEPDPETPPERPEPPLDEPGSSKITDAQRRHQHALFNDLGLTEREPRLAYTRQVVGRDVETSNDLTVDEASRLIDALIYDTEQGANGGAEPDLFADDKG